MKRPELRAVVGKTPLCRALRIISMQATTNISIKMGLLLYASLVALVSCKCYEPQTAHPPPDYDSHDSVLQHAFAEINTALTIAVAAPEYAASSYSIEVTSQKETLWSTHHTARERNISRPDIPEVNGDALYRIASITKAFTVLGILYQHDAGNLSLDATVNTYLEELGEKSDGGIPWKDITIRSLASQLSGIPRECTKGMKGGFSLPDCSTARGTYANVSCSCSGRYSG